MNGFRAAVAATTLLLCGAAGAADAAAPVAPVAVRWTGDGKVAFHGMGNMDQAGGGPGAMMYPAPGLAGFLVAVVAHSAIAEGSKNAEKRRIQETADLVLEPYRPLLDAWTTADLLQRAQALPGAVRAWVPANADATGADLLEIEPTFLLSPDQRALVLDAAVVRRVAGAKPPEAGQPTHVVRVVSAPQPDGEPVALWSADDGARLKSTAAALLAESLQVVLANDGVAAAQDTAQQRTWRYAEGGRQRFERALLVAQTCERQLLRTLRGALLSVPRAAGAEGCPP